MYFSFMMVRTENHSGGTKYTFNPWMTTNTRHLQRICPVLRLRSSLRCLVPSVYELMGFPQRHRDLSFKTPRAGPQRPCSDVCIRLKLLAHRSTRTGAHNTPGVWFHTFSVKDLYESPELLIPGWKKTVACKARIWPPDKMEDRTLQRQNQKPGLILVVVVSTQLIHNAFVF